MAVAETANLLVKMSLGGNFQSQLSKATKGVKTFDRESSRAFKAGSQIGTGIKRGAVIAAAGVGILVTQIGFGLDQLIQLESLTAQTNAALKSTKNAAGQTALSIRNLAEKYESLNATVDDKVIQSGENLLLTFTAIGKQAFEPALAAALDLSTALGTDLNSAIKTVGKALSDPAKAMSRLTRQGIILTKQEQKQIAAHLENNDTLGAQGVVLAALDKRYGGSFLAGGSTTAGKVAKFGDAIEDLQKSLATALLPAVSNIADALNELLRDPEVIRATEKLGEQIGELFSKDNITKGINALKSGFTLLRDIAAPIAAVVGGVVKAFASLPAPLQQALVGGFVVNKLTGGLVTNIFGGIAEAIARSFIKTPLVNVQGGVVNVGGGIPGGGTPGGGLGSGISLLGLAVPAIAAAVGAKLVADNTNTEFVNAGFTNPDFVAPGSGDPFGISSAIHNIGEVVRLIREGPRTPGQGKAEDDVFTPAALRDSFDRATVPTTTAVTTLQGKIADDLAVQTVKIGTEGSSTRTAVTSGALIGANATHSGSAAVVGAIYANRPVVNVNVSPTTISHTTNVMNRYGSTGGSRNENPSVGNWVP